MSTDPNQPSLPGMDDQALFSGALAPEPPVSTPAQPSEAEAIPQDSVQPTPPPAAPEPAESGIPAWRLREESDARRAAEDRARQMEDRLNEIGVFLQRRDTAAVEDGNFFDDPITASKRLIGETLNPVLENYNRSIMAMARSIAKQEYGKKLLEEAEVAFLDEVQRKTINPHQYERVVQSPNRYEAVVEWYQERSVIRDVGSDPKAWFKKELTTRLSDPAFVNELAETLRTVGGSAPAPAVSGSSVVRLPPSLSRTPGATAPAAADAIGDLSDASLYAFARPERR